MNFNVVSGLAGDNLNKPATRLAFVITGNLFQYDYWYIDNVSLKSAGFWMGGTTGSLTDWNTAANWGDDLVPAAGTNAVIPMRSYNPVVNNDPSSPAVCNDLFIYDGATVTVNPGKKIIINGKLELKGAGQMN